MLKLIAILSRTIFSNFSLFDATNFWGIMKLYYDIEKKLKKLSNFEVCDYLLRVAKITEITVHKQQINIKI